MVVLHAQVKSWETLNATPSLCKYHRYMMYVHHASVAGSLIPSCSTVVYSCIMWSRASCYTYVHAGYVGCIPLCMVACTAACTGVLVFLVFQCDRVLPVRFAHF